MADLVVDTNILAEIIGQHYQESIGGEKIFHPSEKLSDIVAYRINKITNWHAQFSEEDFLPGHIVASSLAFVEIARKFDEIAGARFSLEQFKALIDQPPDWLVIESVGEDLLEFLCQLPAEVHLDSGETKPLEWADAIHVATTLLRGNDSLLAATDSSIKAIAFLKERIIY